MDRGDQAQLLERIIAWSKAQAGIRAVALVGSGARQDHPADEWSDIDLVLVSGDPQAYLASTDWLTDLGEPWFMFLERNSAGEAFVRRVLFAGGLDVDFVIFSTESARQGFSGTFLPEIALRDMQVLLDKDGILSSLPGDVSPLLVDSHPTVADFTEVVNDLHETPAAAHAGMARPCYAGGGYLVRWTVPGAVGFPGGAGKVAHSLRPL
jgi:aminoglycoside 6-adenylyltransferase